MASSLPTTPLTEIQAVNIILSTLSESPINSLETGALLNADAAIARNTLHETILAVSEDGWHFNRERNYPLTRNIDGEIVVSENMLSVDEDRLSAQGDIDPVLRGTRLYDKKNHTFIFTRDIKADVVFFLPWEQIPSAMRRYITIKAARVFQARQVGDESLNKFTLREEQAAMVAAKRRDAKNADRNFLTSNPTSQSILHRSPWV